jgi:hypothetical protein
VRASVSSAAFNSQSEVFARSRHTKSRIVSPRPDVRKTFPVRTILSGLIFVALAELSLYAQLNVGGIIGTLYDPSGAVIPGVTVVATNTGTALSAEVVTSPAGAYKFTALPIGYYTVTISSTWISEV